MPLCIWQHAELGSRLLGDVYTCCELDVCQIPPHCSQNTWIGHQDNQLCPCLSPSSAKYQSVYCWNCNWTAMPLRTKANSMCWNWTNHCTNWNRLQQVGMTCSLKVSSINGFLNPKLTLCVHLKQCNNSCIWHCNQPKGRSHWGVCCFSSHWTGELWIHRGRIISKLSQRPIYWLQFWKWIFNVPTIPDQENTQNNGNWNENDRV